MSAHASKDGVSGISSAIVARREGSSSLARGARGTRPSRPRSGSTSALTSSTRRSTTAACPASSSSSVALRAVIRPSVSSRMRAISALDHSRMPARSSSDRALRAAAPSVEDGADRLDDLLRVGLRPARASGPGRPRPSRGSRSRGRPSACDGFLRRGGRGSRRDVDHGSRAPRCPARGGRGRLGGALLRPGQAEGGVDVGLGPGGIDRLGIGRRGVFGRNRIGGLGGGLVVRAVGAPRKPEARSGYRLTPWAELSSCG